MLTQVRLREVLRYNQRTGVFTWRVQLAHRVKPGDVAGCNDSGYQRIRVDGRLYYAHRLAWLYVTGTWPRHNIDHRISLSNRFKNLRDVVQRTNTENQRRTVGATRLPDGRWKAQIKVAQKNHALGVFKTKTLARRAYLKAKRQLHVGCTL